jgi:hypothetical protein
MVGGQKVVRNPDEGRLLFDWPSQIGTLWGDINASGLTLVHYDSDGKMVAEYDTTNARFARTVTADQGKLKWSFDTYGLWESMGRPSGWQCFRAELDQNGYKAYTNPIWLYFEPDTQAPSAIASASDVTVPGGTSQTFTVTFTDNVAVKASTVANNNAAVRVTGPTGYSQLATFVSLNGSDNGSPRTATYRINAPGGKWTRPANGVYTIRMEPNQVADTNGNYMSVPNGVLGSFTVNVNHVPTLTSVGTVTGAVEDQDFSISHVALLPASNGADVDGDAISFRVESISGGTLKKNGVAVVPGSTLLTAGESLVWHPVADANGVLNAFTVKAWDGLAVSSTPVQVKVDVAAVNDAPVVNTTGSALLYTENGGAVAVDSGLAVSDVDSPNLTGATVWMSGDYANGQDALGFKNQAGITGSWNASTGTLTLTGAASVAAYQTALRSVTYTNGSENPSTLARTVSFKVNDGVSDSNVATRSITVPITPVTATASSVYATTPIDSLVNGSGLAGGQHDTNCMNMWLSNAVVSPTVRFDLGASYTLTGMHVWNYNQVYGASSYAERGVNNVDVWVSATGNGTPTSKPSEWTRIADDLKLSQASGLATDTGKDYALTASQAARYVFFDNINNFGDSYTGLSEVRFVGKTADDIAALAVAATDATKPEGNTGSTPFTFTVTRTGPTTGSTTVNYAVTGSGANPADATDFVGGVLPSSQVSFAPGETSKPITVNVNGDTTVEPHEGFTVTLSGASSGAQIIWPTATGTIQDDDGNRPITPVGVTASSSYATTPIDSLINGSGLTGGQHDTNCMNMWLSSKEVSPWVRFDLGASYTLVGMDVWNYNQVYGASSYTVRGVNNVDVWVSATGNGTPTSKPSEWTRIADDLKLSQASGQADPGADYALAASQAARYVFFNDISNFGDSYTGLSEVRFVGKRAADQAPTVSSFARSLNKNANAVLTFASSDFAGAFSDPDGDSLENIKIASLPIKGTLKLSGTPVTANQEINSTQLASLTYTPITGYEGSDSFGWNGSDGTLYARTPATVNLTVLPVVSAVTITPVAATASSAYGSTPAVSLTNGSGLVGGQHDTNCMNMWLSNAEVSPTVKFDLGASYTLMGMHVWNYNQVYGASFTRRGVSNVDVWISASGNGTPTSDPSDWTRIADDVKLSQANGLATYAGEDYALTTGQAARYVFFNDISNFGDSYTGLSKVRFVGV